MHEERRRNSTLDNARCRTVSRHLFARRLCPKPGFGHSSVLTPKWTIFLSEASLTNEGSVLREMNTFIAGLK
jgi:hypothetical protein